MRRMGVVLVLFALLLVASPAHDTIPLPGGMDVQVILPAMVFPDTLVLRENGERVSNYRISRRESQIHCPLAERGDGRGARGHAGVSATGYELAAQV